MKDAVLTLTRTLLVFRMVTLHAQSYNLRCPEQANWKFRAIEKCNSTIQYFCLYNNVIGKYVEGCNGPDWDRRGSKRIYAGDFTRGTCKQSRFQPFKFWTNGSMSDCIFSKSICSEEGQLVYNDDSAKDDKTCRCDYKKNYSFIKTPRYLCFCIPTEEDCSCYIKSCLANFTLSADYECMHNSFPGKPKCIDIDKYHETFDDKKGVLTIQWKSFKVKWRNSTAVIILVWLCLMYITITSGFFFADLSPKWSSEKLEIIKRYIHRGHNDFGEVNGIQTEVESMDTVNEKIHKSCESTSDYKSTSQQVNAQVHQQRELWNSGNVLIPLKPTTDEVNLLRIIHLLFRVACPVVRMTFDNEIQPNQLRKTLYKNKSLLEKRYRRKDKIINDFQWDLLFKHVKGKTVTSEDFDIELMMNLLQTIACIKIGNLYPVKTDRRDSAMLSKIKYIGNETTQLFEGKLSADDFSQYWADIGQAVLKLMSSHKLDIENDQEKVRLLGRLLALNPITIDTKQLCLFIDMSETYPSMILQKLISEYCTLNNVSIQEVLRQEKHQLFHKRIKTESCCKCTAEFATFIKVIPEKVWQALYEVNEGSDLHLPTCSLGNCCKRCVPKMIITIDLSIAKALILNIPTILLYMTSRFCAIDQFLMQNQHTLYHSMKKHRCCKCNNVPSENILINEKEWNKLFMKGKTICCRTNSEDCCCQYSVKNEIEYSDIDDILLSKIFHVACPVLNKIEQDAFLYYLNWTVDGQPLQKDLTELLNVIEDSTFCRRISSSFLPQSGKTIAKHKDARSWVSKHLRQQKATTEQQLEILIRDADGLNVKTVQIPKDFPLPQRNKKIMDLTTEENNFLVVVYGLTKIVYPVIKKEFESKCPDLVLDKIRMEIYEQQQAQHGDVNKSMKNRIHLTQNQQLQLFARNDQESKRLDLKLMIYILKRTTENEGTTDYVDQLDVIDDIQREIVHSSSGVLNDTRFKEILQRTYKAVLHFEGSLNEKKLLNLQHIRHILE